MLYFALRNFPIRILADLFMKSLCDSFQSSFFESTKEMFKELQFPDFSSMLPGESLIIRNFLKGIFLEFFYAFTLLWLFRKIIPRLYQRNLEENPSGLFQNVFFHDSLKGLCCNSSNTLFLDFFKEIFSLLADFL